MTAWAFHTFTSVCGYGISSGSSARRWLKTRFKSCYNFNSYLNQAKRVWKCHIYSASHCLSNQYKPSNVSSSRASWVNYAISANLKWGPIPLKSILQQFPTPTLPIVWRHQHPSLFWRDVNQSSAAGMCKEPFSGTNCSESHQCTSQWRYLADFSRSELHMLGWEDLAAAA